MPPRSVLKVKQNRPISAIYLGKGANSNALQSPPSSSSHNTEGTLPGLPDLPEPPSPSSSVGSVHSGLPSPPATNSTGSGSTGDPATIVIRERPLSHHSNSSTSTSSGTVSTPMKRSVNGSEPGVEDDDYDNDKDDNDSNDDTARLNENVMALQRVKNLAERNRMALHKLSRISEPSPHRSGSETERESASASSSRHHRSPSLSSVSLPHDPSEHRRPRRISAPASGSTSSSNSSHSQRRKRASMSIVQLTDFEEEEDNDGLEMATGTARHRTRDKTLNERDLITQSALAAVASSRRSPLNSRRRAALPKEFRSDLADESPTPAGPSAGRRSVTGKYDTQKASGDADIKQASWKQPAEPVTPFRANRSSTLRDYRRSGRPNPRWSVDDLRSPSTLCDRPYNTIRSNEDGDPKRERRQNLRGGSAESALLSPGGRSLIGEGLRAAGLSKRRNEEKRVEWSPKDDERRSVLPERDKLHPPRAATSMANYRYMDKENGLDRRHRETDRPAHQSPSTVREASLARAEAALTRREREQDSIPTDRAGSSFSRYNHNSHAHTLPPGPLITTPRHIHERISTASPFSTHRLNSQTPGGGSSTNQTEHIKLMLESLTMFETQLNKLPLGKSVGSSTGTGASQPELARNAQSMVYAAERLSGLLKQASGRAVEEQVEAEVEGSSSSSTGPNAQEIGNIWGRVAAEYRENSRVADELVRGMTGFLLGIGRVIRDVGPPSSDHSGGSPSVHGRNASLAAADEEGRLRRDGVSPDVGSGGSGRRSASSRNSWEPRERDRIAGAASGSTGSGGVVAGGQRPESVLARASPATYQKLRSDRELQYETPLPPSHQQQHFRQGSIRKLPPTPGDRPESTRKLFTPREQREQMLDAKFSSGRPVDGSGIPARDSQETVQPLPQSHEPSPTPASRTRDGLQERERTRLTPLNLPKPLPTLPSEAFVRRQTINSNAERITAPTPASTPITALTSSTTSRDRIATVRSSLPTTPINPTIALTPHTVSNASSHVSPHTGASGSGSLLRTASGRSERSQVTFSRPAVSAALTGLQNLRAGDREQQDREAGKEREREREMKRRTIGNMRSARMSLDGLIEQTTHDEDYRGGSSGAAGGTGTVGLGSGTPGGGGGGGNRRWDTHAADRSAATTFLQHPGPVNRRERRRTVTDVWPQ